MKFELSHESSTGRTRAATSCARVTMFSRRILRFGVGNAARPLAARRNEKKKRMKKKRKKRQRTGPSALDAFWVDLARHRAGLRTNEATRTHRSFVTPQLSAAITFTPLQQQQRRVSRYERREIHSATIILHVWPCARGQWCSGASRILETRWSRASRAKIFDRARGS